MTLTDILLRRGVLASASGKSDPIPMAREGFARGKPQLGQTKVELPALIAELGAPPRSCSTPPWLITLKQAAALETYMRGKEMQRPMMGASRRIEGRIGQLLGPAKMGRPEEKSDHGQTFDDHQKILSVFSRVP